MSEIAFHEKAGRSQVGSFLVLLDKVFFSCRVATVAMLPSALCVSDHSLGACWAFSVQPVLPSVWRPVILLSRESNLGQAINAVTGTRLWALCFSLPRNGFVLCSCRNCNSTAVVQWLVHFSTHPQ